MSGDGHELARHGRTLVWSKFFLALSVLSIVFVEGLFLVSSVQFDRLKRSAYFDENFYWLSLSAEAELGRLGLDLLAQAGTEGGERLALSDATEFRLQILWSRIGLLTKGNFGDWASGDPVATELVEDVVGLVRSLETSLIDGDLSGAAASELLDTAVRKSKQLTQAALEADRATKNRVFDTISVLRKLTTVGGASGLGSVLMLAFFAVAYVRMIQRERAYIARINQELTNSVQEREYFIKVASHELRNSAQAALALLDRDWATDGLIRWGTMQAMAGFKENVDSLLDFARSLSGRVDLRYSELDFEPSLHAWIASASQGSNKRVSVHLKGIPKTVFVQRTVLFRSFQNILTNALRHAGSEVVVRAEITNGGFALKLRVQDDGPGIPESVFTGLSDLRAVRNESGGSLGMGLLIVQALVTSAGGRLAFPECGTGAAVEIDLPMRQTPSSTDDVRTARLSRPANPADEVAAKSASSPSRILYCEDAPEIREAFHALLQSEFRDVDQCASVEEFKNGRALEVYDLAVLDYNLGDGSALDVADPLKRRNPSCKIVVLTGVELRELTESPMVDLVLKKPIQFRELVRAIQSVLPHEPERQPGGPSTATSRVRSVGAGTGRDGDLGATGGGGRRGSVAKAR